MRTPDPTPPTCPRCGYDQSGVIATWEDHCPVQGRCPECGTVFAWADLFDPSRQTLRWYAEHARTIPAMARRTMPTLARMVIPRIFWRRVGVRSPTATRRLLMWVLLLVVAAHAAAWAPVAFFFGPPMAGYGLTPTGIADFAQYLGWPEYAALLGHALTWPAASAKNSAASWLRHAPEGLELWRVMLMQVGVGLTWLAVLSALPITRRMARLRVAHLLRAFLLQMAGVAVGFELARIVFPLYAVYGAPWFSTALVSVYIGVWIWSLVWWGTAVRTGWGVRSWTLLALGTIAAVVGGFALMVIDASISYLVWRLAW